MQQVESRARGDLREKKPKSWRKQVFKVALIGGLLSALSVGVARCHIDGGLLDPSSTASRRQAEQIRAVATSAKDHDYFEAHKNDVHADVIAFVGAVCTATESVRTAVPDRPDEPRTVERAVEETKSDLRTLADAAARSADRIDSVALPATDRVLTPGVDDGTWRSLRARFAGAFQDTSSTLHGIGNDLNAREYADVAAASTALSAAMAAADNRLSVLRATVDDGMSRLPIPNSETAAALRSSGLCASSKE
ncbi:hypothetical protein [Nocardia veterana]|uniref:Uncharacterized protein n=1 Tax=Nocardia veterana TaxID=132249 RepID=A0A7X6LYT6_9NOCA|nr:hypothetical protein [Nocardia veterana]NKY87129.1 hypothetical protein [Nocardia veterana]